MTATHQPIVVVGAGIMGLAAARLLQQESGREVIVVEASTVGGGTTPAGAGFVGPWAATNPHLGASGMALAREGLALYRGLADDGADIAFRSNGNIVFYNTDETLQDGLALMRTGPEYRTEAREVSAAEIAELTSGAVDPVAIAGGVYVAGAIQLETGKVIEHLAAVVKDSGGDIREGVELRSIRREGGHVVGVELSTGDISTDTVVVAAGAWLNTLLEQVGYRLPLMPFIATRLVTEDVGLAPTMPTLQGKDFPLWIRESEGGFTWGTTQGYGPSHRVTDDPQSYDRGSRVSETLLAAQHADVDRVARVFPQLREAKTIREIQGSPVYTADLQFCAGEVPGCAGLWVLGGDNESGVSHGPGLARLVVDLLLGKAPICDPSPYRLDRFDPTDFPDLDSLERHMASDGGLLGARVRAFAAPV